MKQSNINHLLAPNSIALVGASAKPGKIGYLVLENVIESGYPGELYPINPTAGEILGQKVYPTITAIPQDVDLAIITVPAKLVPQVAEQCGQQGIKGLVVITSGFSEIGNDDLEDELVETAQRYGLRILGPNVVGFLANSSKLNASFVSPLPLAGKVSLVSQSGALLAALNLASHTYRAGFEKLISIGNMSDIDFTDVIEWLDKDEFTTCISLYMEGMKGGRSFIEAGQRAAKPIVALKAGISTHGAAAAASHTGSLAGAAKMYSAAFQKAGIIQATSLGDLFNRSLALSLQPPMKGDNLLVITNGGGVGVLSSDAAERFGVPLQFAPDDLQEALQQYFPEYGSTKNPVDLTGIAGADWYKPVIRSALGHEWVNGLVILFTEGARHDPMTIAQAIRSAVDESNIAEKPVAASFIGGDQSEVAMKWLVANGIPAYNVPSESVDAIATLREYGRIQVGEGVEFAAYQQGNSQAAKAVIARVRADGRFNLTEIEAREIFSAYQLPVIESRLAQSEKEAVKSAAEIGYPVVLKIVSPHILHKSDAGGVVINIADEAALRAAYQMILARAVEYSPNAEIHGVVVQAMATPGTEVILGSVTDPTFGPAIMFGLGGVFVEVMKDVTFGIAPVTRPQAEKMLGEIRGAQILAGVRGESARDRQALVEILARYSAMVYDLADEIAESDANPAIVYEEGQGVKIVDARIILN